MRLFSSVALESYLDNFEACFWACSGWKDSFWNMVGIVLSIWKEELSQGPLPWELYLPSLFWGYIMWWVYCFHGWWFADIPYSTNMLLLTQLLHLTTS